MSAADIWRERWPNGSFKRTATLARAARLVYRPLLRQAAKRRLTRVPDYKYASYARRARLDAKTRARPKSRPEIAKVIVLCRFACTRIAGYLMEPTRQPVRQRHSKCIRQALQDKQPSGIKVVRFKVIDNYLALPSVQLWDQADEVRVLIEPLSVRVHALPIQFENGVEGERTRARYG